MDAITIRENKMQDVKSRIREHAEDGVGKRRPRNSLETDNNVDDGELCTRHGSFITVCDCSQIGRTQAAAHLRHCAARAATNTIVGMDEPCDLLLSEQGNY